ncbi:hypothetical protein AGR3A_Lc130471 [Agrobacterium tomkonis CFBP 6623]|uniref:Uncharacterized protein n=1 Tax=Agrobacterium tomkonis CFBP 6623 TaxID=1183432 RepID=A0A1S7RHF2_9HYPH|nr:hypothetical protein AGR3A_Lc130471 [Agrobacterium tomkonis CFBP 6623]
MMLSPDFPAISNLRATVGIASNTITVLPATESISAAINPAGPPPTIATCLAFAKTLSITIFAFESLIPISGCEYMRY